MKTNNSIYPSALKANDTIAIVSTSSPISKDDLNRLVGYIEHLGYRAQVMPGTMEVSGYLAGSREQRAAALMEAFLDPNIKLILPATGGKGANHLLELLDYEIIRANPKILCGMSDPSILCNAIWAKSGLVTLHGPSGYDFFQTEVNSDTANAFWKIVTTSVAGEEVVGHNWRIIRGRGSEFSGPVVGGHLGTIRSLVGTSWLPPLNGSVLILEEVFVPWVAIDVALTHLRLAGVFDQIAGLMIGVPVECARQDAPEIDLDELILRCVGGSFPIITNIEFGHTARKIPLPIGGSITVSLKNPSPVLRYKNDFVQKS